MAALCNLLIVPQERVLGGEGENMGSNASGREVRLRTAYVRDKLEKEEMQPFSFLPPNPCIFKAPLARGTASESADIHV